MAFLQLPGSPGGYLSGPIIPCKGDALQWGGEARQIQKIPAVANSREEKYKMLRQHRTIPALRLKHRSGSCGTASAAPRSPYRHLELCGIALSLQNFALFPTDKAVQIIKKENDKVDGHRKIPRICQRSQQPQHDQHHIIGGIP